MHGVSSYPKTKKTNTSSFIQAGQGNSVRGIGSQEPAKVPGTAPSPIAGTATNRPSYTTDTYVQRDWFSPVQAPWLTVQTLCEFL